jgi:hypothetical protein
LFAAVDDADTTTSRKRAVGLGQLTNPATMLTPAATITTPNR